MGTEENKEKLKVFNVDENTARAMCYVPVLGVIAAVVFLVFEKNRKLKWDAVQAVLLWAVTATAGYLFNITIILRMMVAFVNVVGIVVVPLVLALRASQKEDTRLPYLGEIVDKLVK